MHIFSRIYIGISSRQVNTLRRYRISPRFYLIVIGFMLVVFGISYGVSYNRLAGETALLNAAKAEHAMLSAEITALDQEFADLQTDEYIERLARDELGMLYPGEIRYVGN